MLELAQIVEVVRSIQHVLARPTEGLAQSPLREPHPRHQRRYRPHIGEEVSHKKALGVLEQIECALQIALGLPYARHRDVPARAVLREARTLAQLLAVQQGSRGGRQIASLAVQLAHTDVEIARPPRDGLARRQRLPERTLVGVHRFVEAALRDPDLGQGDGAIDGVRDVPRHPHTRYAIGKRPVRSIKIPACPMRQPQQRRCRAAPKLVVLRHEIEHPPGVARGGGHVAQRLGLRGVIDGDRRRETAKLGLVRDDHLLRCESIPARLCRRVQPALGISQSCLRRFELTRGQ